VKNYYLLSFLLITSIAMAEESHCSIKVINHTETSFDALKAKGTIYNLLIPTCADNPQKTDPFVKANCEKLPQETLYAHPIYPATCKAINKWYVILQFQTNPKICTSKFPQETLNKDVVLHFPEDFNCDELS